MSIIVGQAVRKKDFWDRKDELLDIWEAIESGSHVLISAPRRVGKTSIMYKVFDEPKENYIPIYIDTESADSENEFWQKLFHALLEEDFVNKLESKVKTFWSSLKSLKIKKISSLGVEFSEGELLDYKEAFKRLLKDLQNDKKLIIMIDEFAQTIENIIKYEDEKHALSLLKVHRELRQDSKVSNKVCFIYAGSIGLESVVAKMNAAKYINDLNSIKVLPLTLDEATAFSKKLFTNNNMEIPIVSIEYMLQKIEWLIPFYIQLITQELKKLYRKHANIDNNTVDVAIENALEHRNHFESWQGKLKEAFEKNEYLLAKEILNIIAQNSTINNLEIINCAVKHKLDEEQAKEIVHSLVYDGYINNSDDIKIYRFNSAILKMWWYKNVTH
jgi:uncharacterized protein